MNAFHRVLLVTLLAAAAGCDVDGSVSSVDQGLDFPVFTPGFAIPIALPSCGEHQLDQHGACVCEEGFFELGRDAAGQPDCQPCNSQQACPAGTCGWNQVRNEAGQCECAPGMISQGSYPLGSTEVLFCASPCGEYQLLQNGTCVCEAGFYERGHDDAGHLDCLPCGPGEVCAAGSCGPDQVRNSAGVCECAAGMTNVGPVYAGGMQSLECVPIVCGQYEVLQNGSCVCQAGFYEWGHEDAGQIYCSPCDREEVCAAGSCGPNQVRNGAGVCECVAGTIDEGAARPDGRKVLHCVPFVCGDRLVAAGDSCLCDRGYYMGADATCVTCPAGARCDEIGTTVETLVPLPGYVRSDAASTVFYACSDPRYCGG